MKDTDTINESLNTVYPNNNYIENSVFVKEQQDVYYDTLSSTCNLLAELCIKTPHKTKQIVYLAEDMIEIAKSIPHYLNSKLLIDMRAFVCSVVQKLASHAPRVEVGLPINIDEHIQYVKERYG